MTAEPRAAMCAANRVEIRNLQIALKALRVVGARLRRLVGIIEELSFMTVRHRLASFLLRQAHKEPHHREGRIEVSLPASKEFAAQIGTMRELVSRNLSRQQAEGVIEVDGRNVTIRDQKSPPVLRTASLLPGAMQAIAGD